MSDFINRLFDALAARWERTATRRVMAALLVGSFAVALLLIEAARQGWLPGTLQGWVPANHFYAIDVAFTLFLVFEVVGLIFGLATSVANAAGKQVEIFSLILLRQSFKSLVDFPEPLAWQRISEPVLRVLTDAVGALVIFALIGLYYSLQQHRRITTDDEGQRRFVTAKKAVSLLLMGIFVGIGVYTVGHLLLQAEGYPFFDTFYTVLIFSDVLVVFISLGYSTTYHVVFRNSGFAVATMMIRLALAGPPFAGAAMGIVAALFMVALTMAYNRFAPVLERFQRENRDTEQATRRRALEDAVADANADANADAGDEMAAPEPSAEGEARGEAPR
jgi:MFS family permease